jgi:hypothetical protein
VPGVGPLFGANIQAAMERQVGTSGGLDVKVSSGLAVSQIIGPAIPIEQKHWRMPGGGFLGFWVDNRP